MKIKIGIITLAIAGLLMLNIGLISAEEHTAASGTVSGIVADATTGDLIEGATVEVDDSDPVLSATTDANGAYQIGNVPAGDQRFTASAPGYDTETVGADVLAAEVIPVGFTLQPLLEAEEQDLEVEEADEDTDESGKVAGTRRGYVGIYATTPATGAGITTATGFGAFSVITKRGEEIEIQIPTAGLASITEGVNPLIKTPGRPGRVLTDGDQIVVLVEFGDQGDDELTKVAIQIIVKPNKPTLPTLGAVVSVTTDESGVRTIGIMRRNGKVKEMQLGPDAELPEVGDLVTAFQGRAVAITAPGRTVLPSLQVSCAQKQCVSVWKASLMT